LIPFRSQPPAPRLAEGYRLLENSGPAAEALNRLLALMGDPPRSPERWARVLERSLWHFGVADPSGQLVGFVRITSDLALNANLWDLCADPGDGQEQQVFAVLVFTALTRLRRELGGCSVSLSAPPAALAALERHGFMVDPAGIRAMGQHLVRR
jgi:hypothetical protein